MIRATGIQRLAIRLEPRRANGARGSGVSGRAMASSSPVISMVAMSRPTAVAVGTPRPEKPIAV